MANDLEKKILKFQFGSKKRILFYRKMGRYLGNSLQEIEALDLIQKIESDDGKNKTTTFKIIEDVKSKMKGLSLPESLREWIPLRDYVLLKSGLSSGTLKDVFLKIIFIETSMKKIVSAIVAGLAYPMLLLFAAYGFLFMFVDKIVPSYQGIFPISKWQGLPIEYYSVAHFLTSNVFFVIGTIIILVSLSIYSMPRMVSSIRFSFFDDLPPWSFYKLTLGSAFMLALSAMIKSGSTQMEILESLTEGASPYFKLILDRTRAIFLSGVNIGEALNQTKFNFPSYDMVKEIRAFSELAGFDEVLSELSEEWVIDTVDKTNKIAKSMNIAGTILAAGIVLLTFASVYAIQIQFGNQPQ